jgi:hypothetical protein
VLQLSPSSGKTFLQSASEHCELGPEDPANVPELNDVDPQLAALPFAHVGLRLAKSPRELNLRNVGRLPRFAKQPQERGVFLGMYGLFHAHLPLVGAKAKVDIGIVQK